MDSLLLQSSKNPASERSHNKGFVTWDQTSDPSSSVSCLLSLAESWHLSRRQNAGQPQGEQTILHGVCRMKTSWLTPDPCVPQSSRFNEESGQVRSQTKFQACFVHTSLKGLLESLCQIYRHIWISFLKFQPLSFDIFLSSTFLFGLKSKRNTCVCLAIKINRRGKFKMVFKIILIPFIMLAS